MNSPLAFLRFLVVVPMLVTGVVLPAFGQAGATAGAYCLSDPMGPVVYFSSAFDSRMNPQASNDAYKNQMMREFHAYLKARYGFASNSNYPVSCAFAASVGAAEANRATMEGRATKESKKTVEVDWKSVPDEARAAASFHETPSHHGAPSPAPPADHGFCVAGPVAGPLYLSDIFDAVPPVSIAQWNIAFFKFLGAKYGYKGTGQCENGTLDDSRRVLKAAGDGARAAGRQVVETGWKFDAAATSAPPPPPVDPDPEPTHPAPGANATATEARKAANAETAASLAYCQKDKTLSGVFDCLRVQQTVHAYRIAHAADGAPVPLDSLFTRDRLDCTKCMNNYKEKSWAKREAEAQHLKPDVANCIAERFVTNLQAKPFPNRIREHYDAAVIACK